MIYKIVGIILLVLSAIFGINHFAGKYSELNKTLATVQAENSRLSHDLSNMEKTHRENIAILTKEVNESKDATNKAIANASEADKKYINIKDKLNVKTNQYNDLIANGYRLHDTYANSTPNGNGDSAGGQGTNQKGDSATAGGSDNQASDFKLSAGLSRYLITRAGQADEVVQQLLILQDFTKTQHKWILENCNAVEAKSVVE